MNARLLLFPAWSLDSPSEFALFLNHKTLHLPQPLASPKFPRQELVLTEAGGQFRFPTPG
jgi:hypothetical protein